MPGFVGVAGSDQIDQSVAEALAVTLAIDDSVGQYGMLGHQRAQPVDFAKELGVELVNLPAHGVQVGAFRVQKSTHRLLVLQVQNLELLHGQVCFVLAFVNVPRGFQNMVALKNRWDADHQHRD